MVEISYFAVFLLVAGCIAAGVTAAVIHTWSLRALTYSLETRLVLVEGRLLSEVRTRAAEARFKRPSKDEEALAAALAVATQPKAPTLPWWQNPNLKQGGYP